MIKVLECLTRIFSFSATFVMSLLLTAILFCHFLVSMTYHNRLHPWCIIRQLPQMQRLVIARFRRRNEAEAHLKALQRLTPDITYLIIFDPPDDRPSPATHERLNNRVTEYT